MPTRTETSAPQHAVRFPNESVAYRAARTQLLSTEIALRRQLEAVAALRRALPLGGEVPEDYTFEEGGRDLDDTRTVERVRLSQLFQRDGALIVYSFMYGPEMAKACPMCTAMLDGLNGNAPHITQRVNLAVVAKSPLERIRNYARERGWRNLRLLSSHGTSYNRDYQAENSAGAQMPALNVFVKRGAQVHHFYSSELLFAPSDPSQHPRHVDLLWPLWNVFDLTPEGRGTEWFPKLSYAGG